MNDRKASKIDQSYQAVYGPQTNIGGDVGAVVFQSTRIDTDLFLLIEADTGEKILDHYLRLKSEAHIYLDPNQINQFTEILETHAMLLLRGLPGSGKTITGLALAETLRHSKGPYQIYYLNLRHDWDESALIDGIRNRLAQPALFFLDDCQGKLDLLYRVLPRMRAVLRQSAHPGGLIFTIRAVPTPPELDRADENEFEQEMVERQAIMEFAPTLALFRQIINHIQPEFSGLSDERLIRLWDFTGHDLFLLDQLLNTFESPQEIDHLALDILFRPVLKRYFGTASVHCPSFMYLAALAQFGVSPLTRSFIPSPDSENSRAAQQLVVKAGQPQRYYFLHSSVAELIFRALVWADGQSDHRRVTLDYLLQFISHNSSDEAAIADLSTVIHTYLRLECKDDLNSLKGDILADSRVCQLIARNFEHTPLNLIAIGLRILRDADHPMFPTYCNLLAQKISDGTILCLLITEPPSTNFLFLKLIKTIAPDWLESLEKQVFQYGLARLVQTTSLQNLLVILSVFAPLNSCAWLIAYESVSENDWDNLIDRTIKSTYSIGELINRLRYLKKEHLDQFEKKIGVKRYSTLITQLGSMPDLVQIVRSSSMVMANALLDELDENALDKLVNQTIVSEQSVGMLHLTLRKLKWYSSFLLEKLELRIGIKRYIALITQLSSIHELFRTLQSSSSGMAGVLINALDEDILDKIVSNTINAGRSIGILNIILWELNKENPELLRKLEQKIGPNRYIALITQLGSIVDLFKIIGHSSPSMSGALIEALDDTRLDKLVNRAIAADRSIGTLNIILWELNKENPELLRKLEQKIGPNRYIALITQLGSIVDLFKIIGHSSPSMSGALIEALDDTWLDKLVVGQPSHRR